MHINVCMRISIAWWLRDTVKYPGILCLLGSLFLSLTCRATCKICSQGCVPIQEHTRRGGGALVRIHTHTIPLASYTTMCVLGIAIALTQRTCPYIGMGTEAWGAEAPFTGGVRVCRTHQRICCTD